MFSFTFIKLVPAALAIGAIGAGCASAVSSPVVSHTPTQCEVELTKSGRMVEILATVKSSVDASGSYSLTIKKSGSGGTANIRQGGHFSLMAGETRTFGAAKMSGALADFDATMTLVLKGQERACITNK